MQKVRSGFKKLTLTATFSYASMLVLFVLFSFNILTNAPNTSSGTKLLPLSKSPFSVDLHISAALEYEKQGLHSLAFQEFEVAKYISSYQNTAVLGDSTDEKTLLEYLEKKPARLKQNIQHWEKIVTLYPTYRDAWVQLLYLSYNNEEHEKIAFYREKVLSLDPAYHLEPQLLLPQ